MKRYILFSRSFILNIMEQKEKTKEIWKDVPGYEGYYQASNLGKVRSLDRTIIDKNGYSKFYKKKVIVGSYNKGGYRQTSLNKNGVSTPLKFSQIIAMTFLSHVPDGGHHVVDHINGNKTDDRVANLRVITQRENCSIGYRSDKESLRSRYVGVGFVENTKRWVAQIYHKNVATRIGCFKKEIDASNAYKEALSKIKDGTFNPNDYKPKFASKYKGVYYSKKNDRWFAQIRINKKTKAIGTFKTEIEAHEAYQNKLKNINIL